MISRRSTDLPVPIPSQLNHGGEGKEGKVGRTGTTSEKDILAISHHKLQDFLLFETEQDFLLDIDARHRIDPFAIGR